MGTHEPRKRVREAETSHDDDDRPASTRGRPRLNLPLENSKERRRAQIRQAQRAYRGRKEDTIASLSRRVESLQNVIQQMSATFASFDSVTAGAGPELREQIRKTSDQMRLLAAKVLSNDSEAATPSDTAEVSENGLKSTAKTSDDSTAIEPRPPPAPDQILTRDNPQSKDSRQLPDDSFSTLWPSPTNLTNGHGSSQRSSTSHSVQSPSHFSPPIMGREWCAPSWTTSVDSGSPVITPEMINALTIPANLLPPLSYGHMETSFTRRLLRSTLDAAQRLLRNPHADPAQIHRLGRYAVCYMTRKRFTAFLDLPRSRPAHANLEHWIAPVYHLGGAGLHYTRNGIDAGSTRPEHWDQPGRIGPPTLMPVDRPEARNMTRDEVVDFANVKGEWYDSNDVEEYLKTKGIHLDATSSVVEIAEDDVPSMVSSGGTSKSHSATGTASPVNREGAEQMRSTPFGPYWSMEDDFSTPVADPRLQTYGFDLTLSGVASTKAKKLVDVDAFLSGKTNCH